MRVWCGVCVCGGGGAMFACHSSLTGYIAIFVFFYRCITLVKPFSLGT